MSKSSTQFTFLRSIPTYSASNASCRPRPPRPEPVPETQKVLFPDLVENPPYRVLDHFVFQRRNSQWPLPPIAFRYPSSPRRLRSIGPALDSPVQAAQSRLQISSIFLPRYPVYSRRSLFLQAVVIIP